MQIVITGASGFVGQNLQLYLERKNHEVRAVSLRRENWQKRIGVGHAVIHLAGKAHDTSNAANPEEYFKVNRDLTIELFECFLNSDIRDFFYFSSVKAVADTVKDSLYETEECAPQTPYGKSKLEAEQFLLSKKLPNDKRLFIIRPCMIHGRGNKGNLNLLYQVAKWGIPWPLAAFENQRSFLSIDNLNYLIESILLNNDVPSGIYNFADDDVVSTNKLIELIAESLGRRAAFFHISKGFVYGVAKLGDILSFPLNSERLKKLTESYVVSNEKVKRELQLDKLPLTAQEGLMKTIRSFGE